MHLHNKHSNLDKTNIERLDKTLTKPHDANEPFSAFLKRAEEVIETAKVACCPCTLS